MAITKNSPDTPATAPGASSGVNQTSQNASYPGAGGSTLGKRVITALFGGSIFLAAVTLGGVGGCHLAVIFLMYKMSKEFASVLFGGSLKEEKTRVFVWIATGISMLGAVKHGTHEAGAIGLILLACYYLWRAKRFQGPHFQPHLNEMMVACFVLLYLDLIRFLPLLRSLPRGLDWTFLFVGSIWITDTAAYFGGRLLGHRKLYPSISPNKTMEGALSGLVCCAAFAIVYKAFSQPEIGWLKIILVTTCVGLVGQIGDLVESFLKRGFDVKDMGTSLPGHGGYVDRFDGFIFALPIAVFLIRFIP